LDGSALAPCRSSKPRLGWGATGSGRSAMNVPTLHTTKPQAARCFHVFTPPAGTHTRPPKTMLKPGRCGGGVGVWCGVDVRGAAEARVSEGRRALHGTNLADRLRTGTRPLLWTYPGIRGQRAWPVLCPASVLLPPRWCSSGIEKKTHTHKTHPSPVQVARMTATLSK
jgi:hypothetical protein